jgi:arylformamidase
MSDPADESRYGMRRGDTLQREDVDYEAEYNNRARVPEHPSIIEGWARDAKAHREANPPLRIRYGPSERQFIDFFHAAEPGHAAATLLFIHGGYWQNLDPSFFSHMARGPTARGLNVGIAGYDLCPTVRIGDIVEELRCACRELARFERTLVVAGHSAGGHLAACMLGTSWPTVDHKLPKDFVGAAYAISGLFDLQPLVPTSINKALGMDEDEAELMSPLFWAPPVGLCLDAVVGGDESREYLRQSRTIAERWAAAGVRTRFEAVPGANHFTVINPLAELGSAMTKRLAELARV